MDEQRAKEVLKEVTKAHDKLLTDVRPEYFKSVEEFLAARRKRDAGQGNGRAVAEPAE